MSFARFADGAVNSFDPALATQQAGAFGPAESVTVRIETLATILARHAPLERKLDYLNIDCEGLDFEVLQGHDWQRFAPTLITVELHGLNLASPQSNEAYRFLCQQGYLFRGHYFCTSIFHAISAL